MVAVITPIELQRDLAMVILATDSSVSVVACGPCLEGRFPSIPTGTNGVSGHTGTPGATPTLRDHGASLYLAAVCGADLVRQPLA